MRRLVLIAAALAAAVALLAGCGTQVGGGSDGDGASTSAMPAADQRVPITARAVGAIALDHLSAETTDRQAVFIDRDSPESLVGAELRYHGDGEYDGDLVAVRLWSGAEPYPGGCAGERGPCEELDTDVEGARLALGWAEVEPEEDPGYVSVVLFRADGEAAAVSYFGPDITGDPREQELEVSLEDMTAILEDPRLRLRTSPAAVERGEELDGWTGEDTSAADYDLVPSTDRAMAQAYLQGRGGYGAYRDIEPSPLREDFGARAVGGRVQRLGDQGFGPPATIDVFAAPEAPAWMGADPCASERFAGRCVREHGSKAPTLFFAWEPSDGPDDLGATWAIAVRPGEVVAIRTERPGIPDSANGAKSATDWYLDSEHLRGAGFQTRLGLRTERVVLDFSLEE